VWHLALRASARWKVLRSAQVSVLTSDGRKPGVPPRSGRFRNLTPSLRFARLASIDPVAGRAADVDLRAAR
jgi:hypothetical protein